MKRIFPVIKNILLLSIIFAALFTSCTRQNYRDLTIVDGVLTVGVEIGYPPMEYYDTDGVTLLGFDIELTKALADILGLSVNFIDTTWDGILPGLDTNRYDIAVNVTILPERQERYNFTKPYIDSSIVIVSTVNSSINIEKAEDITGYRIAFQGDTTAQYFTERLREQGIRFSSFSYDKIINCFNDLTIGRIDFVVTDNIAASFYTEKENSNFIVRWQGEPDEFIAFCLKKGNEPLTIALNNALGKLFNNGTIQEISKRILGSGISPAILELY
ncbi:MAG: ABC transporter substrate-binding protein [Treponema sp.]|nr:ABC transporter substrate-binding protein [Treponema sp.]